MCVCVCVAQSCPTLKLNGLVAYQTPLSMEFSRQEYWSGLPFPSPGDLPGPLFKPAFPAMQTNYLPSKPSSLHIYIYIYIYIYDYIIIYFPFCIWELGRLLSQVI